VRRAAEPMDMVGKTNRYRILRNNEKKNENEILSTCDSPIFS
jgi:hypothetical protein